MNCSEGSRAWNGATLKTSLSQVTVDTVLPSNCEGAGPSTRVIRNFAKAVGAGSSGAKAKTSGAPRKHRNCTAVCACIMVFFLLLLVAECVWLFLTYSPVYRPMQCAKAKEVNISEAGNKTIINIGEKWTCTNENHYALSVVPDKAGQLLLGELERDPGFTDVVIMQPSGTFEADSDDGVSGWNVYAELNSTVVAELFKKNHFPVIVELFFTVKAELPLLPLPLYAYAVEESVAAYCGFHLSLVSGPNVSNGSLDSPEFGTTDCAHMRDNSLTVPGIKDKNESAVHDLPKDRQARVAELKFMISYTSLSALSFLVLSCTCCTCCYVGRQDKDPVRTVLHAIAPNCISATYDDDVSNVVGTVCDTRYAEASLCETKYSVPSQLGATQYGRDERGAPEYNIITPVSGAQYSRDPRGPQEHIITQLSRDLHSSNPVTQLSGARDARGADEFAMATHLSATPYSNRVASQLSGTQYPRNASRQQVGSNASSDEDRFDSFTSDYVGITLPPDSRKHGPNGSISLAQPRLDLDGGPLTLPFSYGDDRLSSKSSNTDKKERKDKKEKHTSRREHSVDRASSSPPEPYLREKTSKKEKKEKRDMSSVFSALDSDGDDEISVRRDHSVNKTSTTPVESGSRVKTSHREKKEKKRKKTPQGQGHLIINVLHDHGR